MADEDARVISRGPRQMLALEKLVVATQTAAAASLAGGMIAASGKHHTATEAKAVLDLVLWTLYPIPRDEADISWQNDKLTREAMEKTEGWGSDRIASGQDR